MRFALNYSPQALDLFREGALEIDLFKCSSDFPEHIQLLKGVHPVCVHFSLRAGRPGPLVIDFKSIEAILKQTETTYVNIHLGATNAEYPDIPVDSSGSGHRERIAEKMIDDVLVLTKHFGPELVMAETWPYLATARKSNDILYACVDPNVVSTVLKETKCGLLLDIDHVRVSAHYSNQNPKTYIDALPLDRVMELHMTGTQMIEKGWLESHLPMQADDWTYFDWALAQIANGTWSHPDILAFEYGGTGPAFDWRSDKNVIAQQVPVFRKKIRESGLSPN